MFYDIEKFKRFESTVQCTERNLVIIKALLQKNKLSDLGKYLKECSPYDRCQHKTVKERTHINELLELSLKDDFNEKDIIQRNRVIVDKFIGYLRKENLLNE